MTGYSDIFCVFFNEDVLFPLLMTICDFSSMTSLWEIGCGASQLVLQGACE